MGKTLAIFLAFVIGTALIILLFSELFPNIMQIEDNQIQVVSIIAIMTYLVLALVGRKIALSTVLKQALLWIGIFLVIITGYSFKKELGSIYNKVASELMPYKATTNENTASFIKSNSGHFIVEAITDNIPIRYMVDTGASRVVLNKNDALALGYDVYNLDYSQQVSTANGTAWTATVRVKEMRIGNIVVKDVLASISKNDLEQSLLGMSFLERLKSYSIEGDTLTLTN